MKREGEEHKRTRNYVISIIDKRIAGRSGLRRLFDDHTGGSNLKLYCQVADVKTHLSSPDILLLDDDNRLVESIIEVKDQDVSPKNILGILASTSICNRFLDKDGAPYEIKETQLYVVINDKVLSKIGSGKEDQMALIGERMPVNPSTISKYVICSEKKFEKKFAIRERH